LLEVHGVRRLVPIAEQVLVDHASSIREPEPPVQRLLDAILIDAALAPGRAPCYIEIMNFTLQSIDLATVLAARSQSGALLDGRGPLESECGDI
jgi:hypothetical protein